MTQKQQSTSASDSVKVEATPTSISLDVKGKSASRSADALLDLISPFTNAAGWLGDQLSHARRLAAIRAAAKASEQLKKEGISSANIPPKVLLPWLEGASLETNENDSLTDAWAGLFVRAAKSSDAVTISYIETLKKLGKREAELLEFFATDTSPIYSQKFYDKDGTTIFSEKNPLRSHAINELESILSKPDHLLELREFMESWGLQGMCQIIYFSIESRRMIPTKHFREHEHVIANLEHLGLVRIESTEIITNHGNVDIIWFHITKYAFDLVWACLGTLTGSGSARSKGSLASA